MTSYRLALSPLTPREAITDALYRCFIGLDSNDGAMFDSAFTGDDINISHSTAPEPFTSLPALHAGIFSRVGPLDTTHMLNNVRIDYKDGEGTASMKAYALCQQAPPGRGKQPDWPKFTTAIDYTVEVVRNEEDGLWKIDIAVLDVTWTQGDHSVMSGPPPAK